MYMYNKLFLDSFLSREKNFGVCSTITFGKCGNFLITLSSVRREEGNQKGREKGKSCFLELLKKCLIALRSLSVTFLRTSHSVSGMVKAHNRRSEKARQRMK